jgi:hypothetical protein
MRIAGTYKLVTEYEIAISNHLNVSCAINLDVQGKNGS